MLRRFAPLFFFAITAAALLWTSRDYGASYDEPGLYRYAREARQAYAQAWRGEFDFSYTDPIQKHYGPFFLIAASFFAQAISFLGWPEPDRWHLFYSLFYLLSALGFYRLARRWFDEWSALGATLLLFTQPVLWGHAPMNPKDTPFLGFVVWTSLLALELPAAKAALLPAPACPPAWPQAWDALPPQARARILGLLKSLPWLWGLTALGLLLAHGLTPLLPPAFFARLGLSASLTAPYLAKLSRWAWAATSGLSLLIAFTALGLGLSLLPGLRAAFFFPWRQAAAWLKTPRLWLAALLLGLSLSLRLSAGLLALTFALIWLWRLRLRALPLLGVYLPLGALAMLAAWPFLWARPLKNLLKSLQVMTAFGRPGPWDAYPRLLAWQWSEAALLLLALGAVLLLKRLLLRQKLPFDLLLLLGGLALAPVAALMLSQTLLYDNFRQVLFTWSGFFLLAGLAFQAIFRRLQAAGWRLAFLLALLALQAWPMLQLHPYEYVYYNHLAGSLPGAARQGALKDYWHLSLREAAQFLNRQAPAGARILTCGAVDSLQADLRPDLSAAYGCDEAARAGFDYAVVTLPLEGLPRPFDSLPADYAAQRQGVIFTRVIRLSAP